MRLDILRRPIARYVIAGGLSYVIELGVLLILNRQLGFSAALSTALAFWVGLACGFLFQKLLAFRDYQKSVKAISKQVFAYGLLVIFNYAFTITVVGLAPEKHIVITRTLALIATTCWNYFLYKKVIFNDEANYTNSLEKLGNYVYIYALKTYNSKKINLVVICFLTLLLTAATIYGTVRTSRVTVTSADALVSTYLVGDGLVNADINLQPEHTNLLKFPLFYIQSLFGNGFNAYLGVNIFLTLAAVLGWAFLLIKHFGRNYAVLILISLTALVFGSVSLNMNLAWTTIRNIEFPLALAYLLVVANYLSKKSDQKNNSKDTKVLIIATCGYGALLASDMYFQFTLSLAIVGIIFLAYLQTKKLTFRMAMSVLSVVAASILGRLILLMFDIAGYLSITEGSFNHAVPSSNNIFPEALTAFKQALELAGGNIFGATIAPRNIGLFINATVFIASIIASYLLISRFNRSTLSEKTFPSQKFTNLTMPIVALAFVLTFAIYVLTGQVPDGDRSRYLTFMVFLSIPLFIWIIQTYYPKHEVLRTFVACILVLGIFGNAIRIPRSYASIDKSYATQKQKYDDIAEILDENDVEAAITGHWLGATTRFWSDDKIEIAPVQGCNQRFVVLTRGDWYTPDKNKSALLIEGRGYDASFWHGCTDALLTEQYGTPAKIVDFDHKLKIWIYEYDVRGRILQQH